MSQSNEENKTEMGKKLKDAGKLAEVQAKQRREKAVKGSHLLTPMHDAAAAGQFKIEEKNGFFKVSGTAKGRFIYVGRKGGRVDLSGFSVESPAVRQITLEVARAKHLGKVRGQFDFSQEDAALLEAFDLALAELNSGPTAEEAGAPVTTVAPVEAATEEVQA